MSDTEKAPIDDIAGRVTGLNIARSNINLALGNKRGRSESEPTKANLPKLDNHTQIFNTPRDQW